MPLLLSCALLLLTCYWAGLGAVVALDERLARRMRWVLVGVAVVAGVGSAGWWAAVVLGGIFYVN